LMMRSRTSATLPRRWPQERGVRSRRPHGGVSLQKRPDAEALALWLADAVLATASDGRDADRRPDSAQRLGGASVTQFHPCSGWLSPPTGATILSCAFSRAAPHRRALRPREPCWAGMSAVGLGCVKTAGRGKSIGQVFPWIAIGAMTISEHGRICAI
jgi:hypothetical protein